MDIHVAIPSRNLHHTFEVRNTAIAFFGNFPKDSGHGFYDIDPEAPTPRTPSSDGPVEKATFVFATHSVIDSDGMRHFITINTDSGFKCTSHNNLTKAQLEHGDLFAFKSTRGKQQVIQVKFHFHSHDPNKPIDSLLCHTHLAALRSLMPIGPLVHGYTLLERFASRHGHTRDPKRATAAEWHQLIEWIWDPAAASNTKLNALAPLWLRNADLLAGTITALFLALAAYDHSQKNAMMTIDRLTQASPLTTADLHFISSVTGRFAAHAQFPSFKEFSEIAIQYQKKRFEVDTHLGRTEPGALEREGRRLLAMPDLYSVVEACQILCHDLDGSRRVERFVPSHVISADLNVLAYRVNIQQPNPPIERQDSVTHTLLGKNSATTKKAMPPPKSHTSTSMSYAVTATDSAMDVDKEPHVADILMNDFLRASTQKMDAKSPTKQPIEESSPTKRQKASSASETNSSPPKKQKKSRKAPKRADPEPKRDPIIIESSDNESDSGLLCIRNEPESAEQRPLAL